MSRLIQLTKGKHAIVDDEDYQTLNSHRWYYLKGRHTGYAVRREQDRLVYMHRVVINAPPATEVDHINRDGCDNRRANLRLATRSQNSHNTRIHSRNTSKHPGVSIRRDINRWRAQISINGRRKHLGYFATPEEAAAVYRKVKEEVAFT